MSYTTEQWHDMGEYLQLGVHRLFMLDSLSTGPVCHERAPVLLLIHGFPTASWDWHLTWEELTQRYRVIAPDMLGFGFSDKPRGHDYRIMEQADLLEALMAAKGIRRARVLAHDYGDTVAQELLARDVDSSRRRIEVDSCCFLNGGLFPETHRARLIQKLLLGPAGAMLVRVMRRASLERNMRAIFGRETQPDQRELEAFWKLINHNGGRLVLHRLMRYMTDRITHRERWVTALQRSCDKIALINGSADPVSGDHMVARYRQLVSNEAIVELPGIGHYPQLEAPAQVMSHAMSFLEKLSVEGPHS